MNEHAQFVLTALGLFAVIFATGWFLVPPGDVVLELMYHLAAFFLPIPIAYGLVYLDGYRHLGSGGQSERGGL